jgi:hypothetical protein
VATRLTVKNSDDFARPCLRISSDCRKINSLGENLIIVKISDISEPIGPQGQTKILKNQLVHGSSSLLSDSVKNSDSGSAGWQEGAHNTPIRLASVRPHMGHLQEWPFGMARLPGAALGIRVALRLLLRQPLS